MTEKLLQSLSSLLDSAGDDLDLPRLLNALQEDSTTSQQLSQKWRRYHLAQSVLRGELNSINTSPATRVDISAAVMQQLAAEDFTTTANSLQEPTTTAATANKAPVASTAWQWWRGSALAASVALLVITSVQLYNSSSSNSSSLTQQQAVLTPAATQNLSSTNLPNNLGKLFLPSNRVEAECQKPSLPLASSAAAANSNAQPCSPSSVYSPLQQAEAKRRLLITPVAAH